MDIASENRETTFAKIVKKIWNGPYQDTDLEMEETAPMNREKAENMNFSRAGMAKQDEIYDEGHSKSDSGYGEPSGNFENPTAEIPKNVTVISQGTTITGDIKSDSSIEMLGSMTGSIATSGNVKINGKQVGNVQGASIDLYTCTVRGCLNAAEDVNVDSDSVIVGDIKCGNLTIDGKLKGNVHVMGNVSCQGNSVIIGDITSTTITISSGAKMKGKVEISDGSIDPIDVGGEEPSQPVQQPENPENPQ
ncbi:Polymer-forming cytoskeletal [Caprobacter fermentans]|uniref:Polymer-forming cytoskeletal n=1 Tax=Caproicibacter fermentans TaxID=2576756 RepID=A0A6N8HXU5_9FIRM|nr:polymer-forming cytoskeletal protein [Caproicibacter fermentans]MVB10572.1 Polymer-forming cytoskeletal [Caproicibacter fermentans]OCN00958.1 hypothetical protein A7X67_04555 [Clostridium sp. W14A]QNK41602.1 polymer-forming cytoskeletal protein [Caproicibacter fermentans]